MIEKSPLVSIILPTYNRANLLPRAIESILSQDYQNFEIIIVDDGSTDNTIQVVKGIDDKRIIYIHLEKNNGTGLAHYLGLQRSVGEFIGFQDADDLWLPGKLTMQIHAFELFPQLELIFGEYWNINLVNKTKELGFNQTAHALSILNDKKISDELELWQISGNLAEALLKANFIAKPTVIFRKQIVEKIGSFAPILRVAGDFELWWRSAITGVVMAYTRNPLIERYKDKNSITSQRISFSQQILKVLDICQQYALEYRRVDLLPYLDQSRQKVWNSMIYYYALNGEKQHAINAFSKSLRYGNSIDAWLFLAASLAGPKIINGLKQRKKSLHI